MWINLQSLGFQAMHLGGGDLRKRALNLENPDCEVEGTIMRNMWLQHMALADDMVTEREGIEVRNIDGLAVVDYLSPGALTNQVSYVFGPVIEALQEVGYKKGQNLDAAPYDW